MTKLQKTNTQNTEKTPIEVLLDIDENGMTTAKKLYGFLELDANNYSLWCSVNILKNKFAESGKDYIPFLSKEERNNPKPTPDYKLTSEFAKQLSMLSKSERGEQARQYFLACEKGLKLATKTMNGSQADLSKLSDSIQSMTDTMAKMQSEIYSALQAQQASTQQQITALTNLTASALHQSYKPVRSI